VTDSGTDVPEDLTDRYREYGDERLPPGQRETGEPLSLSLGEFRDLPAVTQRQDFHCVTGWSKLGCEFTGVPFATVAERAGVDEAAEHVLFHALDGYTTDLPLSECTEPGVLFAYGYDGDDLPADHGGPIRVVTPHKYAYKGAKWVAGVEFRTDRERGYWEKRGYSDTANPWNEERYGSDRL